jgi:hypothetical protein
MVRMPFTLSHVAAAIPFQRTRLISSALVIGCMAPDFEYFIRFLPGGGFGHTLPGVFLLDLPLALLALWLFHNYAKAPLYAWLPQSVRRRIRLAPASPVRDLAGFALVVLSILIGIATHILWDSFSHPRLWLYGHWQFLHRTVQVPLHGQMEVARVIEHLSSVFGAMVLLIWFWRWFRSTPPIEQDAARTPHDNSRTAFIVVCAVALAAAALRALLILHGVGAPFHIPEEKLALEAAVITAITVFCLGVVVYGATLSGRTVRAERAC